MHACVLSCNCLPSPRTLPLKHNHYSPLIPPTPPPQTPQVELPNGEPAIVQLGVCTGPASAGIIGSECMSFIVTGPAARVARHLADCDAPLTVTGTTWARLGPGTRAMPGWAPVRSLALPGGGCVDAHSLLPAGFAGDGSWRGGREGGAAADDRSEDARQEAAAAAEAPAKPAAAARSFAPCDGSCGGVWTAAAGFVRPRQEAAFAAWHDAALSCFDRVTLLVSVVAAGLVLARRPSRGCPIATASGDLCHPELALLEAAALLGPGAVLLLLRFGMAEMWAAKREQIWWVGALVGNSFATVVWPTLDSRRRRSLPPPPN
jgi:hypothetical protein